MNERSPLLLVGIGTAGCAIARGVGRAYGGPLRTLLADTDASTGEGDGDFALLGGERLAGRGAGGSVVEGRLATEASLRVVDDYLADVRIAVFVTALGGGTGGGATLELAKHLATRGIPTIVFATTPFVFEGEDRQRNARGVMSMIEDAASASFFLPLDKLVGDADNMAEAMRRAVDTVAGGVTLFWRLVERPGYIRLDVERLRHLLANAGRGRFAAVSASGPDRAQEALDALVRSELLSAASGPVAAMVCGVLAGDDLRLSEVGLVADGLRGAFGGLSFDLATVNDDDTFSGRLCAVAMLFESPSRRTDAADQKGARRARKGAPSLGAAGRGRFKNAEPTIWRDEDLDVPTFIRKGISLDF